MSVNNETTNAVTRRGMPGCWFIVKQLACDITANYIYLNKDWEITGRQEENQLGAYPTFETVNRY